MKTPSPAVHLNLNVRGMPTSATLAVHERCLARKAAGRPVTMLGLGQSPFPVPDRIVEALRAHAAQREYLPVRGLPALREAVAEHHRRQEGLQRAADDVLVGPGSKELMFLLQLAYYGDLLVPTPAWVSYAPQALILGRRVRLLETRREDGWRLTPETLDAFCTDDPERPRILVLNYPGNPTGGSYRVEELKELASVARKHRVVLLADEIYGALHHRDQHVSIARFYPEGTIVSGGISKWCGAGGWRLGTFLFPPGLRWLLEAMAAVASETYTSTCAPVQHAAVVAYTPSPEIDEYLKGCRRVLRDLGRWSQGRLTEADIDCPEPAGAFYLFPDFAALADGLRHRGIGTSHALCERLLEDTGVALLPASAFGLPPEILAARLAYVDFDGRHALDAAATVPAGSPLPPELLRARCGPVMEGVDRIVAWAEGFA